MKTIALEKLAQQPIDFYYPKPSKAMMHQIKKEDAICPIVKRDNILPVNTYYRNHLRGAHEVMLTRFAVWERLKIIAKQLLPDYGLMIFDTFRTIETQAHLFAMFYDEIKHKYPGWDHQAIEKETRKFVAHPTDRGHFLIPPHNSGGAIDLAIYRLSNGEMCQFGTEFDASTEFSRTDYFESEYHASKGFGEQEWETIRTHRRILYHLMVQAGFVNYNEEWWHYDLGDCIWARELGVEMIFGSMEMHDARHAL